MFDAQAYRPRQEIETWRKKDPIRQLQTWLEQTGLMHADEITAIEADIAAEIDAAVAFAEAGTWEPVEELERFTLMDRVPQ
jgi:TPP-dependent pyruvate/acetoin dehydrogenase alpha subunit